MDWIIIDNPKSILYKIVHRHENIHSYELKAIQTSCLKVWFRQNVVTLPNFKPSNFRCFLALSFDKRFLVPSRMARSSSSSSASGSWQETNPLSGREMDIGSKSSNHRSTLAAELSYFTYFKFVLLTVIIKLF